MKIYRYMDEMVRVHVRWTCMFNCVAVSAIPHRLTHTHVPRRVQYNWTFSLISKLPRVLGEILLESHRFVVRGCFRGNK